MQSKPWRLFGMEWAPLWIPIQRRLQTLGVLFYMGSFLVMGALSPVYFFFLLLRPSILSFIPPIVLFWLIWDRKTPHQGGRRSQWIREWKIWKYLAQYFPAQLIRTAPLPPDKNYLLACHPHGVISTGHYISFGTESTGFSHLFPGITPYLLSLNFMFFLPVYRDMFLSTGICAVSKESINSILSSGVGKAACIVVGGATESLDAHPDRSTLTIKNRKGFVKMALRHGASLVPVYSFGENTIFEQFNNPEGSWTRKAQVLFKNIAGFAPLLFRGRGVFQYTIGLMPLRRPINVVVGAPIDVPKIEKPSEDQINEYHQKYMDSLYALHEEHKGTYAENPNTQLVLS